MARVLVVGGTFEPLGAMEASVRGHHVVVLEKRPSIGGRASSESRDGFPIGYGPHFLLKKGPLHQLVRKVSKVKPSVCHCAHTVRNSRPRYDATSQTNDGCSDVSKSGQSYNLEHPSIQASEHIASWGLKDEGRSKALLNINFWS